jgi:hypothetical protein
MAKKKKIEIEDKTVTQESLVESLNLFVNVIDDGDPEQLDKILDTLYENKEVDEVDDDIVFDAISSALRSDDEISAEKEKERKLKQKKAKAKYIADKKIRRDVQRDYGMRYAKESKHPVVWNVINEGNYKMFHLVMQFHYTEIYKDGADICPRIVLGQKHYNKKSNKNAFIRLQEAQTRMRDLVKGEDRPEWIVISNDTSMITDRNLLARLNTMKSTTGAVGPYGFTSIRQSGKFFSVESAEHVRGAFAQCSMDGLDWSYLVGKDFSKASKFRAMVLYGPFIAVRYDLFMDIDFTYMAENAKKGNFHYMADISMEVNKRKQLVGVISTQCQQYDRISNYFDDKSFIDDQMVFITKWQEHLPLSCE